MQPDNRTHDTAASGVNGEPVDPVDALLAELVEQLEREGMQGLSRLLAAQPGHAAVLLERVRSLHQIGLLRAPDLPGPELQPPGRLGDFELRERLGSGGMGVVYTAMQTSLGRLVALKLIRPEQALFPGHRERFRREILAIARLQHPGIVQIHAVGEDHAIPHFAMELLTGCSLDQVLSAFADRDPAALSGSALAGFVSAHVPPSDQTRAKSSEQAALFAGSWLQVCLRIAHAVALALDHAHVRGVVHRDVKPSNIMLTIDGRVVLLDFGLATLVGAGSLTATSTAPGSLPWMAPECVAGTERASRRADVYSLGTTLFELLALRRPFQAASTEALRGAILAGNATPLRGLNPRVPRDVAVVCAMAMAREPFRRYATAAAFADDLGNLLARRPICARPANLAVRCRRWCQRHPALTAALIALALSLVASATLVWSQQQAHAASLAAELRVAEARRLVAESTEQLRHDPGLAVILGNAGAALHRSPASDDALRAALAANREMRTFTGHTAAVSTVAWSTDGSQLATASIDHTARVFDVATGLEQLRLTAAAPVTALAFARRTIATGCANGSLRLWNADDGSTIADLPGHTGCIADLQFSPDGRQLATAAHDHCVRIWDVGRAACVLVGRHDDVVHRVRFSPGGDRVVSASEDRSVRIWSSTHAGAVAVLRAPEAATSYFGAVWHAEFDPSGRLIAAPSCDGTTRVWSLALGTCATMQAVHHREVLFAGFSPDGQRLLLTSYDGHAEICDVASGSVCCRMRGHTDGIATAAWHRGGELVATAGHDNTVRLWDATTGAEAAVLRGHRGPLTALAFAPDGSLLATAATDGTARIWRVASSHWQQHAAPVLSIAWHQATGRMVSTAADGTAVWCEPSKWQRHSLRGHTAAVTGACWNRDGDRILTWSDDRTCRWFATDGCCLATLDGHESVLATAALDPVTPTILTLTGGVWRRWSTAGALLGRHELVSHDDGFRCAQIAADGTLAAALTSATQQLRAVRLPTFARLTPTLTGVIDHIALASDGRTLLAVDRSGDTRIVDLEADPVAKPLFRVDGHALATAFSADGRLVAIGTDQHRITIWARDTGVRRELTGHAGAILAVAFDDSGRWLLSRSRDGTARLFDVVSGRAIGVIAAAPATVTCAVWTPAAAQVTVGLSDGQVALHEVDPDPLARARAAAPRRPTAAECERHGLGADGNAVLRGR